MALFLFINFFCQGTWAVVLLRATTSRCGSFPPLFPPFVFSDMGFGATKVLRPAWLLAQKNKDTSRTQHTHTHTHTHTSQTYYTQLTHTSFFSLGCFFLRPFHWSSRVDPCTNATPFAPHSHRCGSRRKTPTARFLLAATARTFRHLH